MGDRTGIAWCDATWNPVTGCDPVSEACDHFYAKAVATRFAGTPAYPRGFEVMCWPDRLTIPYRWARPRRVFVCSMSDLFHPEVPDGFIAQVLAVAVNNPRHTFMLLTKRPARMRSLLGGDGFGALVAAWACLQAGARPRRRPRTVAPTLAPRNTIHGRNPR